MSAVLASRPSVANKVDLLESLPGRPLQVTDQEKTRDSATPYEGKFSYPSAKTAILAGTVGIVALPVISAIALIPATIATIASAIGYAIDYALGRTEALNHDRIIFLFTRNVLIGSLLGLIPGTSLAATALYLNYTEKNPNNEYRRPIGDGELFLVND